MARKFEFSDVIRALVDSGAATPSDIVGCSDSDVDRLETSLGVSLPRVYREFLKTMGRSAGRLFVGTDVFYAKVGELKTWAEEMLQESSSSACLPEDSVVFLMHQGYVFCFFRTSEGDDPPVYRVLEGGAIPERPWESFTEFLMQSVQDCIDMIEIRRSFRLRHGKGED